MQAGTAEELARVLGAHLEGESVGARSFEEREGPLRTLNDSDLWDALHDRMATLNAVAAAGDQVAAETNVGWTGRTMKVPWFAVHMREELVLHGWDITGDDAAAQTQLAQPWMTTHIVIAVGRPVARQRSSATTWERAYRGAPAGCLNRRCVGRC